MTKSMNLTLEGATHTFEDFVKLRFGNIKGTTCMILKRYKT